MGGIESFPPGTTTDLLCPTCHLRWAIDPALLRDEPTLDDPTPRHPCPACGDPYPDILLVIPDTKRRVAAR